MSDINKCEPWCGLEYGNKNVPDAWIGPDAMPFGVPQYGDGPDGEDALLMPAYCTQTCYERAPTTKLRLVFEAAGGAEAFIAALRKLLSDVDESTYLTDEGFPGVREARALLARFDK